MKEKKQRVEDALEATRAAVEEGIVPGGGTVLIRAASAVSELEFDDADEQTGVHIPARSLREPIRIIAENCGFEGAVILEKVSDHDDRNFGFNAMTDEYGDMLTMGIVDPAKVTRSAVENAVSVAGMILTTAALITEKPVEAGAGPAMPPCGGMDF